MPLLVNSGLEVGVVNTLSESWLQKLWTQTSREAGSARADGPSCQGLSSPRSNAKVTVFVRHSSRHLMCKP